MLGDFLSRLRFYCLCSETMGAVICPAGVPKKLPFFVSFSFRQTTFPNSVGVDDHIDPWFLFSPCLRITTRVSVMFISGLLDAARRPTGTPAGDSREKCGQLRPSFVVFADRSGLQKSADMPSVR